MSTNRKMNFEYQIIMSIYFEGKITLLSSEQSMVTKNVSYLNCSTLSRFCPMKPPTKVISYERRGLHYKYSTVTVLAIKDLFGEKKNTTEFSSLV